MMKIEAVVRHHKVDDIKEVLSKAGHFGMTVAEVRGFGRQRGQVETYRGAEYKVDFVPKVKLEIVVSDDDLQSVIEAIVRVARTGQIGDGKIFVYPLSDVIRVRTGETGASAI